MSKWKKWLKVAVAVVAVVVTGPIAGAIAGALVSSGIMAAGLAASVVSGAIAGALVGGVGAAITGGDWKKGALLGAIGGGISGGITDYTAGLNTAGNVGPGDGLSNAQPPGSGAVPPSPGPGDGLVNAQPPPAQTLGGPGDGLAGGANPVETVAPSSGVTEASKELTSSGVSQAGQQVTKEAPGMLDSALSKITKITDAHPWTKDLMKGAGEAVFKGLAAQNTPTEAEQTMDLLKFREEMNSRSIMGLGADPFGRRQAAPNSQAQQVKKPFVPFGQGGMLKYPTGG